ncbi:MAG: hypothetical protein LC725_11580 [Lentisphaerae bacterium]|nr:hypothetical protein [Lentisphaerota bacterium]
MPILEKSHREDGPFGIKTVTWTPDAATPELEAFLARPAFDPAAEKAAATALADIRARGNAAVCWANSFHPWTGWAFMFREAPPPWFRRS